MTRHVIWLIAQLLAALGLLFLLIVHGWAQEGPDLVNPPGIKLQDEAVDQGRIQILNCVGTSITCARSGVTGTATVTGGGGFTGVETEIDFGTTPVFDKAFTITDAGVSATSKILVTQSGNAATGRQQDENEMDPLHCWTLPAAGSFTLRCRGLEGPVAGKFKVFYAVG